MDNTRKFNLADEHRLEMKAILTAVYESLMEKGYNPIIRLSVICFGRPHIYN